MSTDLVAANAFAKFCSEGFRWFDVNGSSDAEPGSFARCGGNK